MRFAWEHVVGVIGLVLFIIGQYLGLFHAPPAQGFGDVVRIVYVHVPAAWIAMVAFCIAFVGAAGYLYTSREGFDWLTEAAVEVGVVLGVLLMITGAIFAKPTWEVYWTWDPRLTSTAVLVLTFVGVLVLRSLVEDPGRRATWSSVVTIFAAINVPITYQSVNWWRGMHQMPLEDSMSKPLSDVLMLNAGAMTLIAVWFLVRRYRIAEARALAAAPPPLPPEAP